jgi:hypothetical protein
MVAKGGAPARQLLVQEGGVEKILAAMSRHADSAPVQAAACDAFVSIAFKSPAGLDVRSSLLLVSPHLSSSLLVSPRLSSSLLVTARLLIADTWVFSATTAVAGRCDATVCESGCGSNAKVVW